jgi:hypothetical protein
MDLNDIGFDAYRANERTLDDPEIVSLDRGLGVRLRIINGALFTNFHIDLGRLQVMRKAAGAFVHRPYPLDPTSKTSKLRVAELCWASFLLNH